MQSATRLALFLCAAWAAAILYGEMLAFWAPLYSCSWPHPSSSSPLPQSNDPVRVAVIADPQLMDSTSLQLPPKSSALETAQFYTDLYMRRSFQHSILPFKPDFVVFLGDLFDNGAYLSDEEWHDTLIRFKHIFALNEQRRDFPIPVYYLSGNHDIGYSAFHTQHPEVISRYAKEFGSRNYHFTAGRIDFVVVDAQTLDGTKQGKETSLSWEFIKKVSNDDSTNPKVLLTHIPLYRPDNTSCGQHRSSPVKNQRVSYAAFDQGITYQSYLSKETSELLLSKIKPIFVLSGHDHDQCTIVHSTPLGAVTEHTLGTVSWQQGNLFPSFMLLSVVSELPPNSTEPKQSVMTNLCFLPKQTHIYIWYLFQFVVTVLLLAFWPTNGLSSLRFYNNFVSIIKSIGSELFSKSKEKDDEENCEYEMVWDAEGSMHLVKKTAVKVQNTNSDSRITGRGNVVARASARKHQLEQEQAVLLDMSSEATLEDGGKLPRSGKSKLRKVIQRLFRVVRLLVVIAALNAPIYMMLLFKDWIDR